MKGSLMAERCLFYLQNVQQNQGTNYISSKTKLVEGVDGTPLSVVCMWEVLQSFTLQLLISVPVPLVTQRSVLRCTRC